MSISLDKSYLIIFGKHIQEVRKSKGLSQDELAIKAETHRSLIAAIEKGKSNTRVNTLRALAKVLEVKPSELLDFID